MLCFVRIEWCWRLARPFKQGGNSFADSGGLKRGRACTRNTDLLSESQGCPPPLHPVIIWITTGRARNSWKVESSRKEFASTISQIEIRNKPMRIEVSQYWPSICLQFWLRSDKTPKRLLRPPTPSHPITLICLVSHLVAWWFSAFYHSVQNDIN